MVKFNPRDKGNKPGIAIMIAVKKPKKGDKMKKYGATIKKNLWEDMQDIKELERLGIDTSFMSRENPNQPPPKIPRKKPDSMDESARQGAEANRQALAGTSVPSEEPEKKVSTSFPWFLMPESKEKAEAMEMAWRFLKSSSISESGMGMDGLDEDGNYKDVTDTRQFKPSIPIEPTRPEQVGESFNNLNMKTRPQTPVFSEPERLANQGFSPQAIQAQNAKNAAAAKRMRALYQPKGG